MRIASTITPEEMLTEQDWMQEFKVGILAPKPNNNRAKEMMDMWNMPVKSTTSPMQAFLNWLITPYN